MGHAFPDDYTQTRAPVFWNPASNYAIFSDLTAASFTITQKITNGNNGVFGIQVVRNEAGVVPGIHFWGKRLDADKQGTAKAGGYQADLDAGHGYTGSLYGELIGGFEAGKLREAKPDIKPKYEWNDYVIVAKGNRIVLKVNGKVTADVTKKDGARSGIIAFVHHGGGVKVTLKDIQLKRIKADK